MDPDDASTHEERLGPLPAGAEFLERFKAADPSNERFFAPSIRPGHAMFDLPGYIRSRLDHAEIQGIEDLGLCTYADPRFFSYRRSVHRREADYGRHINAIVLA